MPRKTMFVFADDLKLLLTQGDPAILIYEMKTEIKVAMEWLTINKLSLNIDNAHLILFKTKDKSLDLRSN